MQVESFISEWTKRDPDKSMLLPPHGIFEFEYHLKRIRKSLVAQMKSIKDLMGLVHDDRMDKIDPGTLESLSGRQHG